MNTIQKSPKLKSLDETEQMLDRAIEFMKQLDPNDRTSVKQANLTLQMADRASKLSDTKIRFEMMRQKINSIVLEERPKELKQA